MVRVTAIAIAIAIAMIFRKDLFDIRRLQVHLSVCLSAFFLP
jgi:hypothetical protein